MGKRSNEPLQNVCPKYDSCRERCSTDKRRIDNQAFNCYCDHQCYSVFQDCCYDYEVYCGKQTPGVNKMEVLDRNTMSCLAGYEGEGKSIWMVTRCSPRWLNKETLYKCENVSKSNIFEGQNIYQNLPVIDVNDIVYHNAFCAQCNNVANFTYFMLNITCDILPSSSLSSLPKIISFVTEYCGPDNIFPILGQNQARRYCSTFVGQNCKKIFDSKKCWKGSVAVVSAKYANYKNIWCAQCNGVPTDQLNCGLRISQGVSRYTFLRYLAPSFELIMDEPEKWHVSAVSPMCPNGKVFDSRLEICTPGKVIPPVNDLTDKYHVLIWLRNLSPLNLYASINTTEFHFALTRRFNINDTQISHSTIHKMRSYFIAEFQLSLSNIQSLRVSMVQLTKFDKQLPDIGELLHIKKEVIMPVALDVFKIFKVTYRRLACITKESYTREEYILLKNKKYYIISTNQTFSSNEVYHKETNITICSNLIRSSCEGLLLYLKPKEYTMFPNLSVYFKSTQTLYNIGDYKIKNNTLVLCSNASSSPTRGRIGKVFRNMTMEILTTCTFMLSLASLAALIFTYLIFSELRRLPGKNLLNLAVSLFLAQLLWLLVVSQTKRRWLCTIITVLEHYLFLVTFSAMSVIAFHTKRILASKKLRRPATQIEDRKQFMIYSGFVWGVPLLFISITSSLHLFNVFDAGYSSKHERMMCWIANRQAQEFLFILPVGLLLFCNTALFIYTIIVIHGNKQNNRQLYASRRSKREEKNAVWVYLKLSSLTGLFWIFGFLDILIDSEILPVLFVLFASLQGFYIALSFLINDRVAKLYRELLTRLSKRSK